MSTGHLDEPVAGRDLLVRADWCREGALSAERKASQASFILCGAAGRQGCTSRCRLPLDRVMGGRKTSERVLCGCAHRTLVCLSWISPPRFYHGRISPPSHYVQHLDHSSRCC